jgi:hypothetical protein
MTQHQEMKPERLAELITKKIKRDASRFGDTNIEALCRHQPTSAASSSYAYQPAYQFFVLRSSSKLHKTTKPK